MKSLKIQVPDGYMIDSFDQETCEIKLKKIPKDVRERIKTIDDILKECGFTMESIDAMFENVPPHFKHQYIAELLCQILNEGWSPNWDDSNQPKYFPWFEMGGSRGFRYDDYAAWRSHSYVGSRLCLKSKELAIYAGKQFTDLYEKFMLIKTK